MTNLLDHWEKQLSDAGMSPTRKGKALIVTDTTTGIKALIYNGKNGTPKISARLGTVAFIAMPVVIGGSVTILKIGIIPAVILGAIIGGIFQLVISPKTKKVSESLLPILSKVQA